MQFIPSIFPVLLACLSLQAYGQETATIAELRETIAKIVETQNQTSREATDWEGRKAMMNELLGIHQKELALLNEELEKSGSSAGGYDETKKQTEAQIAALKAVRKTTSETIVRTLPRLLGITKRLPAPLLADCQADLTTLNAWQSGDEPREALQTMLSVISKSIQFNRRVTRSKEIRDGREVEVLYLGLATAYYADSSNHAGIGRPSADGWKWTSRPELHGEITKAFSILNQKRPPGLLDLPVTID